MLATGIVPRTPAIPGIDHPKVASYVDIVEGRKVGRAHASRSSAPAASASTSAEFLTAGDAPDGHRSDGALAIPRSPRFATNGASTPGTPQRGGLETAHEPPAPRQVWLLQRKDSKVGAGLAKTTGWIRRTLLKRRGVTMIAGVEYERIDDAGLHITVDGKPQVLAVDTIVICAGRSRGASSWPGSSAAGIRHQLIGGADVALELDAKRAIAQGTRVALAL